MDIPTRDPDNDSHASGVLSEDDIRDLSSALEDSSIREATIEIKQQVFDCVVAVVECPRHNKFCVEKINKRKGLFFPTTYVEPMQKYEDAINDKLRNLLQTVEVEKGYVPFKKVQDVQYFRVQVPNSMKFVTRVTMHYKLVVKDQDVCCNAFSDGIDMEWKTTSGLLSELFEPIKNLWGIELGFFPYYIEKKSQLSLITFMEIPFRNGLGVPINKNYDVLREKEPLTANDKMILDLAQFTPRDVKCLYVDFLQHVFPSVNMVPASLISYLNQVDYWPGQATEMEVVSFFSPDNMIIDFHSFLMGIVALDPNLPQVGPAGELRDQLIGRMAKKNRRNILDYTSFTAYKSLKERISTRFIKLLYDPILESFNPRPQGFIAPKEHQRCSECANMTFVTTPFEFTMDQKGFVFRMNGLNSVDKTNFLQAEVNRLTEYMNMGSIPNKVLGGIAKHEYEEYLVPHGPPLRYSRQSKLFYTSRLNESFIDSLLGRALNIIKKDMRCPLIPVPAMVYGPVAGNLRDFFLLQKLFIKDLEFNGKVMATHVFMGNPVDTDGNTLDILLSLLALKVQCPQHVIILRGPGDRRESAVKLKEEIRNKLNRDERKKIEDKIFEIFDALPLACVIDREILVTSNGFPLSLTDMKNFQVLPIENEIDKLPSFAQEIINGSYGDLESIQLMKDRHGFTRFLHATGQTFPEAFKENPAKYYKTMQDTVIVLSTSAKRNEKIVGAFSEYTCGVVHIDKGRIRSAMISRDLMVREFKGNFEIFFL